MELVTERKSCRICENGALRPIASFGELDVSAFPSKDDESSLRAPLDLVLCEVARGGCGLLQLRHTVSPRALYGHYWYRSFTNESMRVALADVTRSGEEIVSVSDGDLVLDVGCNDGTLLRSYRTKGLRLGGFEPSSNLIVFARQGTDTIVNDFFHADAFREAFGDARARILTTIAMFYDLEDPNRFVSDVASCLHDDGVWINQMSYLPLMLERNAFDNVCHEHLEYYSLTVLERLIAPHGLEVVDVELNDVNGGSFRVFARHRGAAEKRTGEFGRARVFAMREFEARLGLDEVRVYQDFVRRVAAIRDEVLELLRAASKRGQRVYGYGASTKGNTLLQYFGIDRSLVPAIAERNPDKWGRKTVGTGIPIISEEQARRDHPDFLLVLPWHFIDSFVAREQAYLAAGGRLIVPLPRVRIVG